MPRGSPRSKPLPPSRRTEKSIARLRPLWQHLVMVFASIPFLFYFLPGLLAIYYAIPARRRQARNLVLIAASLLFYSWGEGRFVLLLLASIAANHVIGHRIVLGRQAKGWLLAGIIGNLALLGVFKYANFITGSAGFEIPIIHLPLGISFFTFQALSYLIDLYRKDASPPENLADTALYIASFPQLIAGPIVRYEEIAQAIRHRKESLAMMAAGIELFIRGLAQKTLLSNLAAGPADSVFGLPPEQLTTLSAWVGIGAYSLQIFFDFAGYSNMAMGLGLMVGFRFPRNFDYPYATRSVTAFWRHWHMTLSRWFRDYLYIPLGGNRHGTARTILNLWVVFLLCGLWHGAAWTFVLWGAWHGAFLMIERLTPKAVREAVPPLLGHLYLPLVVALSWVLFRAETIAQAGHLYTALFGGGGAAGVSLDQILPGATGYWLLFAALFTTPLPEQAITWGVRHLPGPARTAVSLTGFAVVLILAAAFLAGGGYNPFIYFRF